LHPAPLGPMPQPLFAETPVTWDGKVSVMITLLAPAGPAFLTVT
jgi:hypothetical protein